MKLETKALYLAAFITTTSGQAATVVTPGTTQLAGPGTSATPAEWILDDHFSSATAFTVGGSWNQLSIDSNYNFEASGGFNVGTYAGGSNTTSITSGSELNVSGNVVVGPVRSGSNTLSVGPGASLNISGNFTSGIGNIAYYSSYSLTTVHGSGAVLSVTGDLDISSGYNATNNTLRLTEGGMAIIDSDMDGAGSLSLYNHWAYGNCWMELDGSGQLAMWGDRTSQFADGAGILTSIKLWDAATDSFQRVAYYSGQTWTQTEFLDQLSVEYISDSSSATLAGVSDEFIGFTVVQAVPEPGISSLLTVALLLGGYRRRSS